MTLREEIAALRGEVQALRKEVARSNAMAARSPQQAAQDYPNNIPQNLWGDSERAVAKQEQDWHLRNPGQLIMRNTTSDFIRQEPRTPKSA